jgi:hypothetical protein
MIKEQQERARKERVHQLEVQEKHDTYQEYTKEVTSKHSYLKVNPEDQISHIDGLFNKHQLLDEYEKQT